MIDPADNTKIIPQSESHIFTKSWNSSHTQDWKKLWFEYQKILMKYGDPFTGVSVRSAFGMRSPDWKRTVVNDYICEMDNPFYDPEFEPEQSTIVPFSFPQQIKIKPADNVFSQLDEITEKHLKDTLETNEKAVVDSQKEKDIVDEKMKTDRDSKKDKKRKLTRGKFLFAFISITFELLDPYITFYLFKNL